MDILVFNFLCQFLCQFSLIYFDVYASFGKMAKIYQKYICAKNNICHFKIGIKIYKKFIWHMLPTNALHDSNPKSRISNYCSDDSRNYYTQLETDLFHEINACKRRLQQRQNELQRQIMKAKVNTIFIISTTNPKSYWISYKISHFLEIYLNLNQNLNGSLWTT